MDKPVWGPTHKVLAKTSAAVYHSMTSIKKLGYHRVLKFKSKATGTKAYLCIQDDAKVAVLAFRGTETDDPRDIRTDINIDKIKYQNYDVHGGFLVAYQSVCTKIDNAIARLPEDYKVYCTGHSLGGALAALHAVYGDRNVDELVTFGSPRVGGPHWARDLRGINYARYVNRADIVTKVPKWNYFHGGKLHLLTGDGLVIEPGYWVSMKCRLQYWNAFGDHSISRYIENMP